MPDDPMRKVMQLPIHAEGVPKRIKTLIVDDSELDKKAIKRLADTAGLELDFHDVSGIDALREALEETVFDLVLLDYTLPDGTGLDGLNLVDWSSLNSSCATIMLATEAHIQIAVTAMKHGCSDYLLKEDLTPATFRRAIFNAFQKADLQQKIRQAGEVLGKLQNALRTHAERSTSEIRPLIERTLERVVAPQDPSLRALHQEKDMRVEFMELACRNMLLFCDEIERNIEILDHSAIV